MENLRFACDAMLGTLARWLRFAGLDTFYEAGIEDARLAALARTEGRWLLTRDRRLASAAGPRVVLIASGRLAAQVGEVRRRLPLAVDPARFFSRCSSCNAPLCEVSRSDVELRVPPFVAARSPRFSVCQGCGRVYWPGTHAPRIARRLAELFGTDVTDS